MSLKVRELSLDAGLDASEEETAISESSKECSDAASLRTYQRGMRVEPIAATRVAVEFAVPILFRNLHPRFTHKKQMLGAPSFGLGAQ